jgi:hypothetical protein
VIALQMIAGVVLILLLAVCLFQAIGSVGTGDRRAALMWVGDAGLLLIFGGVLAWSGVWS